METVEWKVRGRFSLREAIGFGFGYTQASAGDVMRLAFVLDGYDEHAGVAVTQPAAEVLEMTVVGTDRVDAAAAQAARILSVDVDATSYDALVDGDPLLATAQAARPGLRPVLFQSAYEALLWAVLSARRPMKQMAEVRAELSRAHGRVLTVAGEELPAVPTPARLLEVDAFPGIPEVKIERLHAVAERAVAGELDTATLRARDPAEVERDLQGLPGIGPFYSQLVSVRALGQTDVLPTTEPRVVAETGRLLGRQLDAAGFAEVAEAWRPWRTWASVAIRASSAR
jgi:DNA-3-methyladenine glycosylase II